MTPPDMPPEVFVRLRLLGLTTEGVCEIARAFPNYSAWGALVDMWERGNVSEGTQTAIRYWNHKAATRRTHGHHD